MNIYVNINAPKDGDGSMPSPFRDLTIIPGPFAKAQTRYEL